MKTFLLFAFPPLAGALIGFVTNVIAIKMLFRPLREIRVFGVRLPFTPGILPRQRHKLALSIGGMVERELLTPELLRQRFKNEDVREKIRASIGRFSAKLLGSPLREIVNTESAAPGLKAFARSLTASVIRSPAFEGCVTAVIMSLTNNLNLSLFDLLRPEPEGASAGDETRIGRFVEGELRGQAEFIAERIRDEAEKIYPGALQALIRLLRRDDIHRQLEAQGRIFLAGAILKLNVFQRFFISAGQYDRTLHERMPEIIDDLIDQAAGLLSGDSIRLQLLGLLDESLSRLFASEKPPMSRMIAGLVIAQARKPLGELLPALGFSSVEEAVKKLTAAVGRAGEPAQEGLLDVIKNSLLDKYGGQDLAGLLSINGEQKKEFDDLLVSYLLRIADTQIENALNSVNVKTLVSGRIDSLDMIRVERIILDVMANQLKWIDVFGAILGFTIGLFQSVFSWLVR
ncbi:MAG: DUF445 family protein [Treponema sp.]|nr:DUF445 family protein [Treponema sp.]